MDLLHVGIAVLAWVTFAALVVAIVAVAGRADRREARRAGRELGPRPTYLAEPDRVAMRTRRSAAVARRRAHTAG